MGIFKVYVENKIYLHKIKWFYKKKELQSGYWIEKVILEKEILENIIMENWEMSRII